MKGERQGQQQFGEYGRLNLVEQETTSADLPTSMLMAASSPACQPTHNQNNRLATSTSSGMELAQPQSQASSASITSAAESAAQKLSARGLEHDVQGLGGGRGGSGALSGVDTSAEYTMFMSAEDEPLGAMEDFGSLEPHHMEGSDNEHDHYNEGEASGAEGGAEREGKGRGPYRKRRKDSSGSVKGGASSSGECGTAEAEKAKASRDRNREHARNTRMRKKQYIENLKLQIGEMLQAKARDERDALMDSSRQSAARIAQRQTVLNMFYLRTTEDLSRQSWASVLDTDFTCVTPVTPYRSFLPSEVRNFRRVIKGIDGMIQDTASLAVFVQSICCRSLNPTGQKVKCQFYASADDTVVGPHGLMSRWLMKTENAMECGAQCEVVSHGMLKAQFSPDNRIKHLELEFDVMSLMQQLQRACGGGEFKVVPNTLEAALQPSRYARVVCSAQPPFWITHANHAWSRLMGHSEEEARLFTISLLNGPAEASNGSDLDAIIHQCMQTSPKRAGRAELHVIVRDMRRLKVELQLYPLGTADGALTHFLIIMDEVPMCPALPHPGLDLFGYV